MDGFANSTQNGMAADNKAGRRSTDERANCRCTCDAGPSTISAATVLFESGGLGLIARVRDRIGTTSFRDSARMILGDRDQDRSVQAIRCCLFWQSSRNHQCADIFPPRVRVQMNRRHECSSSAGISCQRLFQLSKTPSYAREMSEQSSSARNRTQVIARPDGEQSPTRRPQGMKCLVRMGMDLRGDHQAAL